MKKLTKILVFIAAAGLGVAIGFAFRGKPVSTSDEPQDVNAVQSAESSGKDSSHRETRPRATDDSPLATKLERDLSMSRGVTNWLYWLDAIQSATLTDFPRLARLAEGNSTATRLLADRWLELSPRNLFDTVAAMSRTGHGKVWDELARTLITEWPKRDPEAVIAALNEPNNLGKNWRMDVANTIFEQDVERGLRLMQEWSIENYGPSQKGVAKWAAADPRHAAEFTLAHPTGYASQMTMETIGKAWAKIDPAAALDFAAAQLGNLGATLAANVLKEWAGRAQADAANWLAATDARTRNRLSPSFVEAWAKQDAAGALTWCDANLTGSGQSQSIASALAGVANKDVAAAGGLVVSMSPSETRSAAAVAVAAKWFPEFSSGKAAKPEAIAWLGQLDDASIRSVIEKNAWSWSSSDAASMAAFLGTAKVEQIPTWAASVLARELARKNPTDALDWASRLPGDFARSAGADAFSEWRNSQAEPAMKWLHDLPTNDPRRQPFFENAVRDLSYHPQAADQFAAMDAGDRAIARDVIDKMTLPADRRIRLLDALSAR